MASGILEDKRQNKKQNTCAWRTKWRGWRRESSSSNSVVDYLHDGEVEDNVNSAPLWSCSLFFSLIVFRFQIGNLYIWFVFYFVSCADLDSVVIKRDEIISGPLAAETTYEISTQCPFSPLLSCLIVVNKLIWNNQTIAKTLKRQTLTN